ncbi:MAG: class I SAM-dependent methyltransferase, partial [Acidobacteria bacterium]
MSVLTERPAAGHRPPAIEDQKRRQVEYHEREHYRASRPRSVDNSHPFIAWVNTFRLRTALRMIGEPLAGKTVLTVCGGDGEEADFLQRLGSNVTTTDLSGVAVQAARLRNPDLHCVRMDTERLAFPDRSFDWVFVRDGLHHLARPLKGLYEMERVSREGFVVLEGQDSFAVRLLVKLGSGDWDPAGGYVYRFTRRDILKIFQSVQTVEKSRISTAWLLPGSDALTYFPFIRRFVYPVIRNRLIGRLATSALRMLVVGFNLLAGRWGNGLVVVAW